MSKTYKRASFCDNDRGGAKYAKRMANKKVRRTEDIPDGYAYLKKIFDSWDIHDWKRTYYTKSEVLYAMNTKYFWGSMAIYYRDPTIYKEKLFTRESIRHMEVE